MGESALFKMLRNDCFTSEKPGQVRIPAVDSRADSGQNRPVVHQLKLVCLAIPFLACGFGMELVAHAFSV
jgi:hypothetical protein